MVLAESFSVVEYKALDLLDTVETGEKASESDTKTALVAKTAATVVLENFILFFSRLILY
jgi:hypothetical protein